MQPPARRRNFVAMSPSPDCNIKIDAPNGTTPYRNPFRISTSGSPRYTHSNSLAMTKLPMMGSRIPRKSPSSRLAPTAQHEVLSTPRGPINPRLPRGNSSTGIGSSIPVSILSSGYRKSRLTGAQKPKRSPPANPNKPLPSPPVLQVVDSSSSPKAQRTLVDADVASTPSSEQWPALTPEIVGSCETPGSQNTNSAGANLANTDYAVSLREEQQLTIDVSDRSVNVSSTYPRECESNTSTSAPLSDKTPNILAEMEQSPDMIVHAFTTPNDWALDSPLAHKGGIPPRVSSKRGCLPLSGRSQEIQMVNAAATAASRRRDAKPGNTKWPLLNTVGNHASGSTAPQLEYVETTRIGGSDDNMNSIYGVSDSMDTYHTAVSKRASFDSVSIWSQGAGSSVYDDEPHNEEPGYRTKRFSGHSSISGQEMTLKIADDADAVLLGGDAPPVPKIPGDKKVKRQSMTLIADRVSQQTASRLSAVTPRTVERKTSHGATSTERRTSRQPTPAKWRHSSISPQSTSLQQSNTMLRKRSSQVTSKADVSASASAHQSLSVRLSPTTANRPQTSPAPARSSPLSSRAEASPSYAKSTIASSRNEAMLEQRATFRKHANSANQPIEAKSLLPDVGANKSDGISRKKKNQDVEEKVRSKRSFRNLFHKRDNKEEVLSMPAVPKRSSLIGSALGGRFRSSANLAKSDQKATDATERRSKSKGEKASPQTQHDNIQVVGSTSPVSNSFLMQHSNLQGTTSPSSASYIAPAAASDAVTIVNNIITRVSELPDTAPDRLRGLEIAEALLASIEACKHAQISATRAQQHAHQAGLLAERATIESERLFKLCKQDLDKEAMEMGKVMNSNGRTPNNQPSLSTASRSISNPQ